MKKKDLREKILLVLNKVLYLLMIMLQPDELCTDGPAFVS